ncbi:MAG: efflux RND transporter periplasmic adaptor subunit [Gammaproteobacteria bacterium]|nr:efflux RND transporter periplasmic adaptor subunit [Gammaproteobacteria bacterium]
MLIRFVLMLAVAVAIFGGIAYTKYRQIETMAATFTVPPEPTDVAVTKVKQVAWQKSIVGTGSLTAVQDVFVTNEERGLVAAVHFESGQIVTTGAPLVSLDTTVDAAVLSGLMAEQRLAEVQYERAAKLVRDKTMSQSQFDEAAARRDRVAADVVAQQARVTKKTIRAPFSGTLGIRRVDVGDYLVPGSNIVPLQTLDPIFIDSAVPEKFLPSLALKQKIRIKVQAYPNEWFHGEISAIESGIDPDTRMVRIRAVLSNTDQRLRPGMFAEINALQGLGEKQLVIPETAITYSPYGNSVFVVIDGKSGLTVERRQVETGESQDGVVAISKGLALGERVVTVGQNKLRNGMTVAIAPDAMASTPK